MNILLHDMTSYIQKDLIYYLEQAGHHCHNVIYSFSDRENDPFFISKFSKIIEDGNYDCIMGTNFFPLVAKVCYEHNLKYISWSYDSPIDHRLVKKYNYPTSYLFLFDESEVEMLKSQGLEQIYHLPLAANTLRLDKLVPNPNEYTLFNCDISFIGQLYNNKSKELISCLTDEDKKIINDLINRQCEIYGKNIIREEISEEYANHLIPQLENSIFNPETFIKESFTHLFLKEVSHRERLSMLERMSANHNFKFYSVDSLPDSLHRVDQLGTANYFTQMPKIFKSSTININSCLRSIESGIPLRCIDIMGCGALLMSSWQKELDTEFGDGKCCILYKSVDEACEKADYYLSHKDLCKTVALAGYQKIKEEYNYPSRIQTMLSIPNLL